MPLPEDWDGVDWRPSVVILPNMTEGVPTIAISRVRYPAYPRGYFMMAYRDANATNVVGYNAADLGSGGRLVSEFVFWHEMGHHHLGHTGDLQPGQMEGVSYTANRELDADQYAFVHWADTKTAYGVEVILAAIRYFHSQGNALGDAEHPAPVVRMKALEDMLAALHLCKFVVHNDDATPPEFVAEVLRQCFDRSYEEAAELVRAIERDGQAELTGKGTGRKARVIDVNEASKIVHFVSVKMRLTGHMAFNLRFLPLI